MSFYEDLVMETQNNYYRCYSIYAHGGTAAALSQKKPRPYEEQIRLFVKALREADCIVVGGASGLSAAGKGDFYYTDTPSSYNIFVSKILALLKQIFLIRIS